MEKTVHVPCTEKYISVWKIFPKMVVLPEGGKRRENTVCTLYIESNTLSDNTSLRLNRAGSLFSHSHNKIIVKSYIKKPSKQQLALTRTPATQTQLGRHASTYGYYELIPDLFYFIKHKPCDAWPAHATHLTHARHPPSALTVLCWRCRGVFIANIFVLDIYCIRH